MRSSKFIHVVSAHAEGEVGDVITGGVAPPKRSNPSGINAHGSQKTVPLETLS